MCVARETTPLRALNRKRQRPHVEAHVLARDIRQAHPLRGLGCFSFTACSAELIQEVSQQSRRAPAPLLHRDVPAPAITSDSHPELRTRSFVLTHQPRTASLRYRVRFHGERLRTGRMLWRAGSQRLAGALICWRKPQMFHAKRLPFVCRETLLITPKVRCHVSRATPSLANGPPTESADRGRAATERAVRTACKQ